MMIPQASGVQFLVSELAQAKLQVAELLDERLKLLTQIAEMEKALKEKSSE